MDKKQFRVLTVEHRMYLVTANSKKEADEFLRENADLTPKDDRVSLEDMGDFEIVK